MEEWKIRAADTFPTLAEEIIEPEYTLYDLLFEFLPFIREAAVKKDQSLLKAVFDYASWCSSQKDEYISNAVAVGFYEHLFDDRNYWGVIVQYLDPKFIKEYWTLYLHRHDAGEIKEIKDYIDQHYDTALDLSLQVEQQKSEDVSCQDGSHI